MTQPSYSSVGDKFYGYYSEVVGFENCYKLDKDSFWQVFFDDVYLFPVYYFDEQSKLWRERNEVEAELMDRARQVMSNVINTIWYDRARRHVEQLSDGIWQRLQDVRVAISSYSVPRQRFGESSKRKWIDMSVECVASQDGECSCGEHQLREEYLQISDQQWKKIVGGTNLDEFSKFDKEQQSAIIELVNRELLPETSQAALCLRHWLNQGDGWYLWDEWVQAGHPDEIFD